MGGLSKDFATQQAIVSATQGVSGFAGALSESAAIRAQGEFQRGRLETNAKLAGLQAKSAKIRGERAVEERRRIIKRTIGAQRASLAAQGIEVDTGSALALQEDTAVLGAEDVLTIRNNAWLEAFGFKTQAIDLKGQAGFADISSKSKAKSTILTGGLEAIGDLGSSASFFAKAARERKLKDGS